MFRSHRKLDFGWSKIAFFSIPNNEYRSYLAVPTVHLYRLASRLCQFHLLPKYSVQKPWSWHSPKPYTDPAHWWFCVDWIIGAEGSKQFRCLVVRVQSGDRNRNSWSKKLHFSWQIQDSSSSLPWQTLTKFQVTKENLVKGMLKAVKWVLDLVLLQSNQLDSLSFTNSLRIHEVLGSESKNFLTHSRASRMTFILALISLPSRSQGKDIEKLRWRMCTGILHRSWGTQTTGSQTFYKQMEVPNLFLLRLSSWAVNILALCSTKKLLSLSSKVVHSVLLEKIVWIKGLQGLCPHKHRNKRNPGRGVLSNVLPVWSHDFGF